MGGIGLRLAALVQLQQTQPVLAFFHQQVWDAAAAEPKVEDLRKIPLEFEVFSDTWPKSMLSTTNGLSSSVKCSRRKLR